jgi:hypothetical protein
LLASSTKSSSARATAPEQRRVDLRDRRSRERLRLDADERVRRQLLGDDLPDLLERNGRNLVDELAELLDVDVR